MGIAFSLSDAISIEKFLSPQIAAATGIYCFLSCVKTTLGSFTKGPGKFMVFSLPTLSLEIPTKFYHL